MNGDPLTLTNSMCFRLFLFCFSFSENKPKSFVSLRRRYGTGEDPNLNDKKQKKNHRSQEL